MKKSWLKLLRDIKNAKGQFVAITLVIAIGAFFSVGLKTLSSSLDVYTTNYYEEHNLSDLNVYYSEITNEDINTLKDIKGINKIEGRYTFEGMQTFDEFTSTVLIHTIPTNNEINTIEVIEGRQPSNKDEILIDFHYAIAHDYKIGDRISISTQEHTFEFIISGFGENVEHTYNIKDPILVIPNHKTYGVAYINEKKIVDILGEYKYNELLVDVKSDADIKEVGERIENRSSNLSYLYQLTKEQSMSYSALNISINNNQMMSRVLPIIFFIVAAVTIFLTMSRIIDSQRSQIGIMKALGFKNRSIILQYMGYPILASIIGSVVGSIVGLFMFIKIGRAQLSQMYSLPNFDFTINGFVIVPAILISLIFGSLAAYLSCRNILKESASQAMRLKPPKKMKKILVERFTGIWKRCSYGNKIILRNIFMNKQKALFTSIGVIICVILLIIAFGYKSSMDYVGEVQLNKVYQYDLRIDYKVPLKSDALELPDSVQNHYTLKETPIEFGEDEKQESTLIITTKENTLVNNYNEDEQRIDLNDTGVIIPKSYAEKYNLNIGDKINIKFISPELKGRTIELIISNISVQYTAQSFYITPTYLKTFEIDYKPTTLLVDTDEYTMTYNYFDEKEMVNKVTGKEDLQKSVENSLEQSTPVIVLFVFCAVILSSAAIYTISSINIYERTRELATLKVLGYQKNKINRLVFIENMMITVFSIVVALPLGVIVYKVFTKSLSSVNQLIPEKLDVLTLVIAVLITMMVTVITNLLLRKKLSKINMIESLKSIE